MKEIKLSTIIYNTHSHLDGYAPYDEKQIEAIENCIKEGVNQALDIASEEATCEEKEIIISETEFSRTTEMKYVVNKDSILSIKNRIK